MTASTHVHRSKHAQLAVMRPFAAGPKARCVWSLGAFVWLCCSGAAADAGANTPNAPLRAPQPLAASPGAAAEAAPAEALGYYARGRALYLEGHYSEALVAIESALALDPDSPDLHFNVARLHELLGEIDPAIASYVRYRALIEGGDPAEIARTDATLKRLRGARFQVRTEPDATPAVASPGPPTRGVADAAFWTVGGLGIGALLGAAGTGGFALWLDHKHEKFVLGADGGAAAYAREGERLQRVAYATDALTIAGSTLTISAILLYVLRTKPAVPALSVDARRGQIWVGFSGHL